MPFGFSLSGSGSKSKTSNKTDFNTTGTTTTLAPDWVQQPAQNLMGQVGNLANTDWTKFAPGPNALQTDAAGRVAGLNGSPQDFDLAGSWLKDIGGAQAPSVQASTFGASSVLDGGLDRYFSPYNNDVIAGAAADFDFNAGRDRARETLDMAGSGAFGGSGAALTRAAGDEARGRSRFSLLSGLRDQGFRFGASLAEADAGRRQQADMANAQAAMQASMANANLQGQQMDRRMQAGGQLVDQALARDDNARTNAGMTFDMGSTFRDYEQEQGRAPFEGLGYLTDIWGSLGQPFLGQTTTESGTSTSKGKSKSFGFGFGVKGGA